jgi:O-antigen/teichoic acid export membrane protein
MRLQGAFPVDMKRAAHQSLTNMMAVNSLRRRLRIVLMFFAGQGLAQMLNLLAGFLVLRWLDVSAYGQYGLTFGFQSTVNLLIDLGFSSTIVALVGHRVNDRNILGEYVRAGRDLRTRMLLVIFPVSMIAFFHLTNRLNWSRSLQLSLLCSILVSIYFSGMQAYYTAPLIVQRKLATHYWIQGSVAAFRVVGYVLLFKLGQLGASVAVWLNAAAIVLAGFLYRRVSRKLISEPAKPNRLIRKQMIDYVTPNLPSVIFFALQGQISVFLIAAVGHNKAVAQVSALGRLGQIFTLVTLMNGTLIEPWFAKSAKEQVVKRYLSVTAIVIAVSIVVVAISILFPEGFLWILGTNYKDLHAELTWIVLNGCTAYLAGLTWTVISGRRFIYWTSTFVNIIFILLSQVLFLTFKGIASPLDAVKFGYVSVAASLMAQVVNLCYGLKRGPRFDIATEAAPSTNLP